MKTIKIAAAIAALAIVLVGATLATVYAFGWGMHAQTSYSPYTGMPVNTYQGLGPVTQADTSVPTLYTPTQGVGPGYMNGWGRGGCMGRWGYGASTTTSLTISQAVDIAKTYVGSLDNPDLEVKEVEEFTNNFYVLVVEKSTGNGAFELLIHKATGIVTPEMGPNMMWNTKYSFGMGWCNWVTGTSTETVTVTIEEAKAQAQEYLNSYLVGATVGDVTEFSGYFTIEVLSNEEPYGMLSVNGFTGQVWYHTWHGAFIQEHEVS